MTVREIPAVAAQWPVASLRGDEASSVRRGGPSAPEQGVLLTTKLHVPGGKKLVCRPALVEALRAGGNYKLTLIDAPAGWGKTTLLAQWVADGQEHRRFAWLSLDPADNDPVRFWTYVVAALQHANPGMAAQAGGLLAARADRLQEVLPALLNELAGLDDQIVLLLDDYHLVTSREIHQELAFVISRMPPGLRLVLATRSDPPLPLPRLRAGGDLLEVRAQELRFAAEEAAVLLNDVLGLDLSAEEVALLSRRTEGWAAGLYLAALSLKARPDAGTFIRAFAGDNRHIVDYLSAEVLDGQPADLHAFLLRTSVLGRLSGPLCDAVLQTAGSAAILARIERDNLFLIPLDPARHWYRYHHLFAELLHSELQRTEPGLVPALHQRAAEWLRAAALTDDAVHHLAAAGDVPGSAELIAAAWIAEFNRGHLAAVTGWLDLLPGPAVAEDPRLCAARALIALDQGQLPDGGRWIEAAEAGLATSPAADGATRAEVAALRALQRFKTGDVGAAVEAARQAIRLDPGGSPLAPAASHCAYGAALYWSGATAEAWAAFGQAVHLAEETSNHLARTYALGYQAMISADRGQLAEAEQLIFRATGDDRDVSVGEHFVNMMTSLATARLLARRDDTARAAEAAQRALVLARRGGGRLEMASALLTQAEVLRHLGEAEAAGTSIEQARTVVRRCKDPGIASQLLTAAGRRKAGGTSRQPPRPPFGEELTGKELDVLRLLPAPLSRREIGARLYVSVNTVKTHQRSLYRKLDVTDRSSAVRRARELGII